MPRISRAVVPGIPHHVTQRGNRRQRTFFSDDDYRLYLELMAQWCDRRGVEIWAWCLMPNHAHMVAVPQGADSLRRAIGEAHRRYTCAVNRREGWQGHLWQGRFFSFAMDERYTLAAARYVELNPVRAGLVARAEEYPWSSARAHLRGRDDRLAKVGPLLERVDDWAAFLAGGARSESVDLLRKHHSTGRPLGSDDFVQEMEERTGRALRPRKVGRPRKAVEQDPEMSMVSPIFCGGRREASGRP